MAVKIISLYLFPFLSFTLFHFKSKQPILSKKEKLKYTTNPITNRANHKNSNLFITASTKTHQNISHHNNTNRNLNRTSKRRVRYRQKFEYILEEQPHLPYIFWKQGKKSTPKIYIVHLSVLRGFCHRHRCLA